MKNIDLIKRVDAAYPDLKDTDIIETFAKGKQLNGKLKLEIKDYNLTKNKKNYLRNRKYSF